MTDLTDIIKAILALLAVLVSTFLIPYIKQKVDAEKLDKMRKWVRIAVEAAEQIYRGSGHGAEKKEYVLSFLRDHGFTVDAEKLETLVESAVLELKKQL